MNDARALQALSLAVLAPIAVALLLLPFRDELQAANIALVLVLAVLVGAIVGGRIGGALAAIVAAVSFDFLFTRPYYSFQINSGADVPTVVLLGLSGIIVGILNSYDHFTVPALTPVAWNLVIILGLLGTFFGLTLSIGKLVGLVSGETTDPERLKDTVVTQRGGVPITR